jgi:hypothetical protein
MSFSIENTNFNMASQAVTLPSGCSWWDCDVVDGKVKYEPVVEKEKSQCVPTNWDDEIEETEDSSDKEEIKKEITIPIITVSETSESQPIDIQENLSGTDSDSDDSEDEEVEEENTQINSSSKMVTKKKKSKKNDTEKMNTLLDKLLSHIQKNKNAINTTVFTVGKQGYVSQNLTNDRYMVPGYGYLMIFLKKAESYYYHQGVKKVNISKLRNDIDVTKTNLRIAIAKQDIQLQQKLCDKLIDQKKILEDAMVNIKNVEQKNTPLDYVKSAIRIVKKNNDKSLRFVDMFRDRVYRYSIETEKDAHVEYKDTQTVQVTVHAKPSVFGKKTLSL